MRPVSPDDPNISYPRVRDPLAGRPSNAPILRVLVEAALAPRVFNLPVGERLRLFVRLNGDWERLGAFRSDRRGRAVLPAFRVEIAGGYLMRVPVGGERFLYLKVRARLLD